MQNTCIYKLNVVVDVIIELHVFYVTIKVQISEDA